MPKAATVPAPSDPAAPPGYSPATRGKPTSKTARRERAAVQTPGELKVETWPLSRIKPYPGNPRNIPQAAIDAVAKSIKTFGWRQAIVVDAKGVIIAGHTRLKAAHKLGLKEAPVHIAQDLTAEQVRALRLADNATGEHSSWNLDALPTEPARLKHLLGLGGSNGQQDPDEIPEPPKKPRAKLGQLWMLGEHRLLVGDSTKAEDVERLMGGEKAQMVFTDPPFGVDYTESASKQWGGIKNDALERDHLIGFLTSAFKNMLGAMAPNAAAYIWHASATRDEYSYAMRAAGLWERQYLIWSKGSIVMGHADYHWSHEPAFYACRDGESGAFHGDRAQSTVWSFATRTATGQAAAIGQGVIITDGQGHELFVTDKPPKTKKRRVLRTEGSGSQASVIIETGGTDVWEIVRDTNKAVHPNQKPVALAARAIQNSSKPGETILDLFLGSGTTIIACQQQGRRCLGMELDPIHASTILARFEAFTGIKPILAK